MGTELAAPGDRRHVSVVTRAVVVKKVRELERQRESDAVAQPGKSMTVEAWLKHWLATIAVARVQTSTYQGYESKVRQRIIPTLGHHRLDRLQPEYVERLYADMLAEGCAATVLQVHRLLSRALKVAVQRGRVARNVCTLVDAPSLKREEIVPLDAEEARRVLACRASATRPGGRSPSHWGCGRARPSGCSGRTSTWMPGP